MINNKPKHTISDIKLSNIINVPTFHQDHLPFHNPWNADIHYRSYANEQKKNSIFFSGVSVDVHILFTLIKRPPNP